MTARRFVLALAGLGWTGLLSAQQVPDATVTFDGLVPVENARLQNAWVDPEVDLSRFTQYLPGEVVFEFREVRSAGPRTISGRTEFPISERNQERLIELSKDVFSAELLASEYFTLADEPGYDVLIIDAAVIDVVSRVPPQTGSARNRIYLDSVGEATLVIQLRDSQSKAVIARGVERRAASRDFGTIRSSSARNWSEVGRLLLVWAGALREALDSFHGNAAPPE